MIGTIISKYRIETLLNSGPLGDVYTASHVDTKEKVIIRCLNFQTCANIEIKLRLKNELYLLSQINHQGIARVYEYSESGGNIFIITEFVQGKSLKKYREGFSDFFSQIIQEGFYSGMLDIFSMMHMKEIIHGHINPSNILVTPDNKIKVINFGLSEFSETKTENASRKNNENLSAISYSSPEQLQGKMLSNKSDIYSLGVLLFFLLKGKNPYENIASGEALKNKIINEDFPTDVRATEGIPEKYIALIKKATDRIAENRFLSCDQFKAAFNIPAKDITAEKKSREIPVPPPVPVNKPKVAPTTIKTSLPQQTVKKLPSENNYYKSPNVPKNNFAGKGFSIGLGVVMVFIGVIVAWVVNSDKEKETGNIYNVQENQYNINDSFLIQQQRIIDSISKSDEALISDSVYNKVDEMPVFPGGDDSFKKWIKSSVHYPQQAKKSNIHGNVIISFVIDENGRATDIKIKKDIGGGCGEEAASLISRMPGWKPGKQNGKNVKVHYEATVPF